jgi:hypothetical protein
MVRSVLFGMALALTVTAAPAAENVNSANVFCHTANAALMQRWLTPAPLMLLANVSGGTRRRRFSTRRAANGCVRRCSAQSRPLPTARQYCGEV